MSQGMVGVDFCFFFCWFLSFQGFCWLDSPLKVLGFVSFCFKVVFGIFFRSGVGFIAKWPLVLVFFNFSFQLL